MRRRVIVAAAAVAGAVVLAPVRVPAHAVDVLCDGLPATVVGTTGSDTLTGTPGPDVISGLAGNDLLVGMGGDDVLCGDEGADVLEGGDGGDRLLGGLDGTFQAEDGLFFVGGDTVRPGPGDDHVDLGEDDRDLEGDPSADLLDYGAAPHGVTVDLTRGTALAEGTDSLVVDGVHHVLGTAYDDVLLGSGRGDVLCGAGGDDDLRGLAGRDVLDADGFLGSTCDPWSDRSREADAGDSPDGRDHLDGGVGRDVLVSLSGDDVLVGGSGADALAGLRVEGGLVARGGAGNDDVLLVVDRGADLSVRASAGEDRVVLSRARRWQVRDRVTPMRLDLRSGAFAAGSSRLGSLEGFENLVVARRSRDPWRVRGTAGPNQLSLAGVRAPVRVLGRGGDDDVRGGHGDDLLDGGPGDDTVIGGAGHDRCVGAESPRLCEEHD